MPDWLVEEGIGEDRAIRLEQGEITAARVHWHDEMAAGRIDDARLVARAAGSKRGTVRFSEGAEALVDRLPPSISEGSMLRVEITRSAMAETGRLKFPQARPTGEAVRPAPSLAEALRQDGYNVDCVRQFPVSGWEDVLQEAFEGHAFFAGCELILSPTPAMTLVDIDGTLPPRELALAAVPAIAATLERLDIAGSVGIDFPTLSDKADRRAVDQALADALDRWPHERTAMNGFGFVQLVSRLKRPSILQRVTTDRRGAAARLLLRRGEHTDGSGAILLTAHPAITARLIPEWLAELARRTGREIRTKADPALALEGGFAQAVAA